MRKEHDPKWMVKGYQEFYYLCMNKPYEVVSLEQLLVIACPGREDIIDAIGVIGPCTVPELGRFVGRSRHALYYHVRVLRNCGLLLETHHSGEGKRTTARYDLPGRPLHVRYDLTSKRGKRAVIQLARTRLRSATRGFVRACAMKNVVVSGPHRNLWVARWKGWMSIQELAVANQLLWQLVNLLRPEPGGHRSDRKCHEFTFSLAPIVQWAPVVGAQQKRKRQSARISRQELR